MTYYHWKSKFDEDLPATMKDVERTPEDFRNLTLKLGIIFGADSELFGGRSLEYMRELITQDFPAVVLENAKHHLFLDQPLAFIDALKGMLRDLGN